MFDPMLLHFDNVKKKFPWVMVALAAILSLAIIIGGLFFNLDVASIMSCFGFVVILVFAIVFLYLVIAFIGWFLFSPPFVILFVAGAFAVIFVVAFIFIKLVGGPVVDIGSVLEPIFAFMK
jgi:hypothetical protein